MPDIFHFQSWLVYRKPRGVSSQWSDWQLIRDMDETPLVFGSVTEVESYINTFGDPRYQHSARGFERQ